MLHYASIQTAAPLWSPPRGFYLVILLFHCIPPARRRAASWGVQQTPRAVPLIRNTQPTMAAGEEGKGERKKEKKVQFMFELEWGVGVYSWHSPLRMTVFNQIHNSLPGKSVLWMRRGGGGETRLQHQHLPGEETREGNAGGVGVYVEQIWHARVWPTPRQRSHYGQGLAGIMEWKALHFWPQVKRKALNSLAAETSALFQT